MRLVDPLHRCHYRRNGVQCERKAIRRGAYRTCACPSHGSACCLKLKDWKRLHYEAWKAKA